MEVSQLSKNEFATIKNYACIEKIGEGGYGLVYKAEQMSTGQTVAIKTIKFKDGTAVQKRNQQLARFERETKLCAEINHPNIVQLLDKGYSDKGEPYAVFEYIEGETLKEFILRNNSLPAPEMAVLMGQVLDALVCAHAKGIVHRDLKPHNIMVSKLGSKYHTKILDFGIGAFTHDFRSVDYRSLTVTQDVLGTPTYSAPEQLRGEAPTVKSDLYAWGLIVIECLTGKPVMDGGSIAEVFQQQLMPSNVPIPPAIVGHDLAHLLRRVLEKNPRNRAGDVESIFKEFEKINFNRLTGDIVIQRKVVTSFEEATVGNDMVWSGISGSRKQLTVLCLKLNLVIANDVHLDLEILDAIQKDQLNLCKDTAIRYGGHVSGNFMNHLAVYFGYPESNGTDARRAGRTALELVTEIKKRSALLLEQHGVALSIQIGLHTGTVLVQRNHVPEGNVPNTALELVYKAAPGNVVVSASSKKLLDQFLEFEKIEFNTKEVFQTFQLVGERQTEALSSLRPWSATREMIGRENEKTEVLKHWNHSSEKGIAVIINGQAGIGKSKLTYEVKKEVRSIGRMVRECRCLPEHQNNALYPFFNMLRNHWGILEIEDNNVLIDKVKNILEVAGCNEKGSLPLLCSWLSISLPEDYIISQATPEEQKRLLFQIIKQCILQIDTKNAFLLVVEDLHWLDPTSTEFIQFLLSDLEEHRYLLVMTLRPIFENPWKYDYLLQVNLETLSKNAIQLLVEGVLGGETISNKTLNYIEQRADGVPLFIEELTSMLLEHNYIQLENKVYELVEMSDDQVPMTLQDLLNARLDRLSLAKETAQLAATIGREFSYELLVNSSLKDEATVQSDLNLLMDADLIYRQRRVQGENYIFRHALIRDAAYEGMVVNQRKEIHGRIAVTLESSFSNQIEEAPFQLAQHYSSSDNFNKASEYGIKAMEKQIKNSSNQEALSIKPIIKTWIDKIDNTRKYDIELKFNDTVLTAIALKEGWGSHNVNAIGIRNKELIKTIKDQSNYSPNSIIDNHDLKSDWVLFSYLHAQSKREQARTLGEQILKKSKVFENHDLEMTISSLLGQACHLEGDIEQSKILLSNVMDKYNLEADKTIFLEYGTDPYIYATGMLGFISCYHGSLEKAIEYCDKGIKYAKTTENNGLILTSYVFVICLLSTIDYLELARKYADEVLALYEDEFKDNWVSGLLYIVIDWTKGKTSTAVQKRQEIIDSGQDWVLSFYEPSIARTFINDGEYKRAIDLMTSSIERQLKNNEQSSLPVCYNLLAKSRCCYENKIKLFNHLFIAN